MSQPAGSILIHEKKPNGKLFTLYAGWAFRYKTLSDGRRQILNFLLPGDLIGLQQKFSDNAMHGIEAVIDVSLCLFPHEGPWELFRGFPRLGDDITWLAAREEGRVDENLLTTGRRNAAERVAILPMHLYRRLERLGLAHDGSVAFPINQQHIADTLGLSLVHANKTLRRLHQMGCTTLPMGGCGRSIARRRSAWPNTTMRRPEKCRCCSAVQQGSRFQDFWAFRILKSCS